MSVLSGSYIAGSACAFIIILTSLINLASSLYGRHSFEFQVKECNHYKDQLETYAVDLKKKKLPSCCKLLTEYDSLDVILRIDTSENPC